VDENDKKAETLAILVALDKDGSMNILMQRSWMFRVWEGRDFQNLRNDPTYKTLVKKWKAWYKKNKHLCKT
jgi:hypothetical protein